MSDTPKLSGGSDYGALLASMGSDEHNRRLLENVHPPDWVNPEPPEKPYHLVVIGAGTAGLVAAAGAAGLGARVALIERHLMGGDCLNVGCVPSKGLIRAARAWHAVQRGEERFAAPGSIGTGDFPAVMARMRKLRADLSRVDSAQRFRGLGVDVFIGSGRFVASDAVEVAGKQLRFKKALIATGARAAVPPVAGLEPVGYLTNETVFNLTELPRRLAVVGGGPIGCELAQAFARFGSYVTIFDSGAHLLHREDADAAAIVQGALERDGVQLELGVRLIDVLSRGREGRDKLVRFERTAGEGPRTAEFVANEILIAAGRAPNVEGLGLEAAGVEYTAKGVTVDDRLRTSNRKIFAAGDICSRHQFTHNSDAQARIVLQNALFPGRATTSAVVLPWCTYTSPEIAHVGMYERDAQERGVPLDTLTVPLREVDRAVLDGEDEGFLRLHLKKGSDRILGATLVAEHAGDMMTGLCLAVSQGVGLGKIAATVFPYPTQGEVLKKAADAWRRTKLTPTTRKILELWFRLTG
jgi:pyruvate/2-oxoglutarate dehydrogenase complex dihydrolipoamide dehydrogenase (E3) component